MKLKNDIHNKKHKTVKPLKIALPLMLMMGGGAVASSRNRGSLSTIRGLTRLSAISITEDKSSGEQKTTLEQQAKRSAFGAFTNKTRNKSNTANIEVSQEALAFLQENDLLTAKESVSAKLSGDTLGRKTFVDFCLQADLRPNNVAPNPAITAATVTAQANLMKSVVNQTACIGGGNFWHVTTGGACSGPGTNISACMNSSGYWSGINVNSVISVAPDTAPTASSVSFSGTLQVGELLTSSYSYFDADSDVESGTTFKWYASDDAGGTNKTQIATTENFTLTAGQVGKYISFEVTPVNANASGSAVESAINGTAVIAADTAPTASSVSFSGTLQVGELLTSSYTYFDADSDVESGTTFKWYASDDAGGTNKTQIATTENFTLTAGQVGKYISFEVTPVNANASGSAVESAINGTAVIAADTAPTASSVSFSGTLQVGELLTSSYTYFDA
ncbi:hypothetical protein, partial [Colwellia sp. RSH04]|uniref:hypothetical protein n=1 Tax=Colwellia sp. RSH04 TaxID=2305464 RepID=UPI000EC0EDDE